MTTPEPTLRPWSAEGELPAPRDAVPQDMKPMVEALVEFFDEDRYCQFCKHSYEVHDAGVGTQWSLVLLSCFECKNDAHEGVCWKASGGKIASSVRRRQNDYVREAIRDLRNRYGEVGKE